MTEHGAKRLIMFGFTKKGKEQEYSELFKKVFLKDDGTQTKPEDAEKELSRLSDSDKKKVLSECDKLADSDEMEVTRDQLMTVDYPKPISRYYIIYEAQHEAVEPIYFWSLGHLKNDWGFPIVHKITDIFTAGQQSSYYGASAQRLGLAQDKVAQYMATIGKMVKDLFQLVRELRWIDERMGYYKGAIEDKKDADEIVLKGLWVDLVDGVVAGQKTAANLFIMAQQLQFTTLPDLFFNIHPKTADDVDKAVEQEAGAFNPAVTNALKRKLAQYLRWRDTTYKEIKVREQFTIDYLRQHFTVIKMYMTWVKPYLKHIQKLTGSVENLSRPELVSAFESNMIELEILGQKIPENNKEYYTCVMLTFEYRSRPALSYAQEGGYHRGPIHVGETKVTWRSYSWTQQQIDNYLKMKDLEDLELLSSLDQSLKDAMDAMGTDLMKYLHKAYSGLEPEREKQVTQLMEKTGITLEQAQQILHVKAHEKPKQPSVFKPFFDVGEGFRDLAKMILPTKGAKKLTKTDLQKKEKESKKAETEARFILWQHYKNFKKANAMITW
ncbi:hypothetical protein HY485_01295 [Candidatus Woesearchaeota archaeon]|nr:hypothetical protein [Candidatus Woesearchaeota archaeon]